MSLRLILIIAILYANKLTASNFENLALLSKNKEEILLSKSIVNNKGLQKRFPKRLNVLALVVPPTAIAGNSCGPGIITLSATGVSGDIIEWFASQTSVAVLATGNTYSPNVSTTTTFYVSARNGSGTSTRVPVVASVYNVPPAVSLSSNPVNNTSNPLCLGTSVTFTASGGADLFEFSVDGIVKQAMSSSRIFTTNALTNGQIVSVRSRYAVTLDGTLSDNAWGTAALEDNVLSASLSGNAANGYINALKISPTEDKLVFGIAGKALNYRRIMVFLDTKSGGFNVSNYGDEADQIVRAFNYFNDKPSTFDSYFAADYCIAIATDGGETNYYADVIELKTGNSIKSYLGTAATGSPTAVMGVNKNNTGVSDYNLGFEVLVSKALVGYTGGDIKFFAFTAQDNTSSNYNVTNSFLSPATRTTDYGSGAIDYNLEAPNPVVVAGAALTPCYSMTSISMNFVANPTVATVGDNQSRCSLVSATLGGNTPLVGTGAWSKKSGLGTYTFDDSSKGNAIATVSDPGTYIFTWTISSGQCSASTADITVVYNATPAPTGLSPQNFCKISNPKVSNLVATGNNIEWYSLPSGGTPLPPGTDLATGLYYAEQTNATTLCKSISRLPVNVVVDNPAGPTVPGTPQTFCNTAKVSNLAATGTAVKWYAAPAGGSPLDPNTDLVNGETYYATQTVTGALSCESTPRIPSTTIINTTPAPTGSGSQTVCNSGTIADLNASGSGTIQWYSNLTGGSPLPTSTALISGTTYYASQTIGTCESVSRYPNMVTINNPQIPVSKNQSVCATKPLQTLTATATVSSGTIIWYDALTGGTEVPSPTWNSVGSITYYAGNKIGSCSSVSRTPATLEILDSPFLSLTTNKCSGDLATYTAAFTVASGSTITWLPAEGSISGNSITGITSGINIVITADMGNSCVEKIDVTAPDCSCPIVSNPINDGDKAVCEGQVNPILSATVVAVETIDWYSDISGGVLLKKGSLTYQPTKTLPGVYAYHAQARNIDTGCLSSGRTAVSLNITSQSKPTGPSNQTFCESQNATVGDLLPSGPGIQWYAGATGGSPLSTTVALVAGKDYYASQTATTGLLCESFERLKVTVIINKPVAPTGPNPQVFCNAATVGDLQVTGSNIKWYDSSGNLLTASTPLTGGVYSATQTIALCESVSKLNVTVTIEKPSAIVIPRSLTFCESDNATVASLSAKTTFGVNIQWYSSATGNTPLPTSTLLIDALYYGSQKLASGCESTPRAEVDVKINAPASPTGDKIQLFCFSQSAKISDFVVTGIGTIVWYNVATAGSPLPISTPLIDGTKYYAAQIVLGCESVNRLEISAVIVNPLTPTIVKADPLFCESQNATLNSIVLNGIINNSNVVWYDSSSGGVVLSPNTLIALGGVYYAVQRTTTPLAGCESGRLKVSPVLDQPQPGVMDKITQPTCAVNSGSVSFSGLPTPGNWTIIPSSGIPVTGSGATYEFKNLAASINYTFKVTNGNGCTSVNATPGANINAVPTAPVTPTESSAVQPTCATTTGSITITPQSGMEYSLDGIMYQSSNVFSLLAPRDYTLYVRNILDVTCLGTSGGTTKINAIPTIPITPVASSLAQPTCAVNSGSITIASQAGMEYSLDGITFQLSNVFSPLVPNNYTLYVQNTADASCSAASVSALKINAIPTAPVVPTILSVEQPTCAVPSGTITIKPQVGKEYSLDGITYQLPNVFNGLTPNNYTLNVRNIGDATCMASSLGNTTIDAKRLAPVTPTLLHAIQPTCLVPFGTIEIASMTGVEYSIGSGYQNNPEFLNLAPANYIISVRFINDITCKTAGSNQLISAIPPEIQFESSWTCESNNYELTASPLSNSYDPNAVEYIWKDQKGNTVGTNSNVLNVSEVLDATAETETFPLVYNLTVKSNSTGCETTSKVTVESIYCDIQKGISPDGNGSNDYFDLRLMDVKKLEIFNRYGLRVYSQSNYTDQWNGQANNGEALPSATYYYVIEFNKGESKTGWIYLIREN